MSADSSKIRYQFCDYSNPLHNEQLIKLINSYMSDPMGDCPLMDSLQEQKLLSGLSSHPSSFILFIIYNNEYAGLATCFINFSTFKAASYINLHDIIIYPCFRGAGLGRALLEKIISIGVERKYCKVTLEVRDDNTRAMQLYQNLGFANTKPGMHFWTKYL